MNEDVLIAIYGIVQKTLRQDEMLGSYGQPLKKRLVSEEDYDTVAIYKWLSQYLRGVSEHRLNERAKVFNDYVRKLTPEYWLNNFLLAIFMLEYELTEYGTTPQKIVLSPKIDRLVKVMRKGIMEVAQKDGDDGIAIVKDSKIAASNICRMMRGLPELTKQMREYRLNKWKQAAKEKVS